jgi:hypothetical protein
MSSQGFAARAQAASDRINPILSSDYQGVIRMIFKLLKPTHGLPSRHAKVDHVTTAGRGYEIVVANP